MNDKTEQPVTDAPRGTAAGGHAVIINVPGCPLMVRAVDYNTLRAQLAEAQRDAERYRSLRRGQKWSVIDWKGDALRADDLDAAIDAAKGEPS